MRHGIKTTITIIVHRCRGRYRGRGHSRGGFYCRLTACVCAQYSTSRTTRSARILCFITNLVYLFEFAAHILTVSSFS